MKTSDKILISLIAILFIVPFLFAYTIKSKMDKGEYTVEKFEKEKNVDNFSGSFTAFKVVKVIGPGPDHLSCRLQLSSQMKYEYNNYWKQKIEVFNNNDTLVISYKPTGPELHDQFIRLKLPAFTTLIVDGAEVTLDSVATGSNVNVTLKNNAIIRDETKRANEDSQAKRSSGKKEEIAELNASGKVRLPQVPTLSIERTHIDLDIKEMILYPLLDRI